MWRTSDAKQTLARYTVPRGASARNRARAAKAHFGAYFGAKTLTFPAFKQFAYDGGKSLDTAHFGPPAGFGHCRPFEWYIRRFAHIYRDAGVLPRTIFQIEAVPRGELTRGGTSGLCLRMVGHARWGNGLSASDELELTPCGDVTSADLGRSRPIWGRAAVERGRLPQWWHAANRRADGRCCSGLRAWNSDQCITTGGRTLVCDLGAAAGGQGAMLDYDESVGGSLLRLGSASAPIGCLDLATAGEFKAGARLTPTSCASARTSGSLAWRRKGEHAPVEFQLLSADAQADWTAASSEPSAASSADAAHHAAGEAHQVIVLRAPLSTYHSFVGIAAAAVLCWFSCTVPAPRRRGLAQLPGPPAPQTRCDNEPRRGRLRWPSACCDSEHDSYRT